MQKVSVKFGIHAEKWENTIFFAELIEDQLKKDEIL